MAELLAFLGKSVGGTVASWFWLLEEPDCPESLIK